MSSYIGRHAELYDIFYAEKPYRKETEFVVKMLKHYAVPGRKLLEIACGTGSHAVLFAEMGWNVTAIDYSADMIRCAKQKASENQKVNFIEGDMRQLDQIPELAGQTFDAAVCLFDSIGYTLTNEGVASVLANVHKFLKSRGIFCFEYWHTAAMLREYSPVRIRRWKTENAEILRVSETTLDLSKQTAEICFDIIELMNDGSYARLKEIQHNRFFSTREMEQFLSNSELHLLSQHDGYNDNEHITAGAWHIVCFARK